MTRDQVIKAGSAACTFKSRIIHLESVVRMTGEIRFAKANWYSTKVYGNHLNRITGFSTDIFGDDRIELMWKPAQSVNVFEIYAQIIINRQVVRQVRSEKDLIFTSVPEKTMYFDIKHYIPEAEDPMHMTDTYRLATFAVNGNVVVRAFGVTPGWAGWMYNFRYRGSGGAPWEMRSHLHYELNKIQL